MPCYYNYNLDLIISQGGLKLYSVAKIKTSQMSKKMELLKNKAPMKKNRNK